MLNTNTLSMEAYCAIRKLDDSFVGTHKYIGIAWFWNYEYRHSLRGASYYRRRLVHKALLADGLNLGGKSEEHRCIIERIAGFN